MLALGGNPTSDGTPNIVVNELTIWHTEQLPSVIIPVTMRKWGLAPLPCADGPSCSPNLVADLRPPSALSHVSPNTWIGPVSMLHFSGDVSYTANPFVIRVPAGAVGTALVHATLSANTTVFVVMSLPTSAATAGGASTAVMRFLTPANATFGLNVSIASAASTWTATWYEGSFAASFPAVPLGVAAILGIRRTDGGTVTLQYNGVVLPAISAVASSVEGATFASWGAGGLTVGSVDARALFVMADYADDKALIALSAWCSLLTSVPLGSIRTQDAELPQCASATPSRTPPPLPSASKTHTKTATASPTPTKSATSTRSQTRSPTHTRSATVSHTPTKKPKRALQGAPSASASPSASTSSSASSSRSETASWTSTPSPSATACDATVRGPRCFSGAAMRYWFDASATDTMVVSSSYVWRMHDADGGAYDGGTPRMPLVTAFPACSFGPARVGSAYPGLAFNTYGSSVLAAPYAVRERSASRFASTVSGGGVLVVLTATFVAQSEPPAMLLQFGVAPCNSTSPVAAALMLGADTLSWVVGGVAYTTSLPLGDRTVVVVQHGSDGRTSASHSTAPRCVCAWGWCHGSVVCAPRPPHHSRSHL